MHKRIVRVCAIALWAAVLGACVRPRPAWAEEPNGRRLYLRYCASCHGESGNGDGPDAAYFAAQPRNLREGFLRRYPTTDLVRRLREGRSLELAIDVPALKARAGNVETIVVHMKRLPTIDWRRVEPGWEIYIDRCEACHGPYGRPPLAVPPGVRSPRDLSDPEFQRSVSDKDLTTAVRHGRAHMPMLIPQISESQAANLAAFVRLLSPGFELYSRHCAVCHGDDGRGVDTLIESSQVPSVAFDRAYFAKRDTDQIHAGVWHMLDKHQPMMPHFRWDLTEAQAQAIIEYLKQTEPKN